MKVSDNYMYVYFLIRFLPSLIILTLGNEANEIGKGTLYKPWLQ